MLSGLRIARFKAFGPLQRAPLRPITLLFGANSAGKSSVIHALALAHHAIETGELDTHRTQIGGDSIDLGGFRQYVHQGQQNEQVEIAFEVDAAKLSGRTAELLGPTCSPVVEVAIGGRFLAVQEWLDGRRAAWDGPLHEVCVERFRVEVDGADLLSMSARSGGDLALDRLAHEHPVFQKSLRSVLSLGTTIETVSDDDLGGLTALLDRLVPDIAARRKGLFPRIGGDPISSQPEIADRLLPVGSGRREEDLARAVQLLVPAVLRDLVGGLSTVLDKEIRRLHYLGPLRSYPPRHLAFSQHHDPNWFAGGGYAWHEVRDRPEVRDRVNQWLGAADRLKTPYEIRVRDLLPTGAVSARLESNLRASLRDLTERLLAESLKEEHSEVLSEALEAVGANMGTHWSEHEVEALLASLVDSELVAEEWIQTFFQARRDVIQDLVLIDKRSKTPVSHRDVGIGISQVLPVLVSAYASSGKLIAIEQPEIHLHPALQAELGDVFLESALGGAENRFLIETHSEHLLLRIMRRMRQTTSGEELPEGVPAVRPEDVAVLFVEPDGGHSLVREMPLNERGELVKAWPGGFFEESMREIF